jgi:hypothetical protein
LADPRFCRRAKLPTHDQIRKNTNSQTDIRSAQWTPAWERPRMTKEAAPWTPASSTICSVSSRRCRRGEGSPALSPVRLRRHWRRCSRSPTPRPKRRRSEKRKRKGRSPRRHAQMGAGTVARATSTVAALARAASMGRSVRVVVTARAPSAPTTPVLSVPTRNSAAAMRLDSASASQRLAVQEFATNLGPRSKPRGVKHVLTAWSASPRERPRCVSNAAGRPELRIDVRWLSGGMRGRVALCPS